MGLYKHLLLSIGQLEQNFFDLTHRELLIFSPRKATGHTTVRALSTSQLQRADWLQRSDLSPRSAVSMETKDQIFQFPKGCFAF